MVEKEVEGEYGKGIVTYPDTVKSGGPIELTAIWKPESFFPLRTTLLVEVRWIKKAVAYVTATSWFGKESERTKESTVTVGGLDVIEPVPPGETMDLEIYETRGLGLSKGHRLHVGTIQVED